MCDETILMNDRTIYRLVVEDLQNEAMNIVGRHLTADEVLLLEDRLSDGINEQLLLIYPAIFEGIKK